MERYVEIDGKNIKELISNNNVVCCRLRNSRIKSKQLAIMEMLLMNYDLGLRFIKNGPLGDVKGLVSFLISKDKMDSLKERLNRIGYFNEFYLLDFDAEIYENKSNIETINPLVWKGLDFSIETIYKQDEKIYESQSPHNRTFKIVSYNGEEKVLNGYRGNGTDMGRRALPVEDARCLVNLSIPFNENKVLEPFAGGGGIIYMYKYINPNVDITSIDIDETLKPGLEYYGAKHIVGSSANVHLSESYDAIVTEVPFSNNATDSVVEAIKNVYANLDEKGIIVLMCGAQQSHDIANCLKEDLNSNLLFKKELNRKGTDVVIQIWTKNFELYNELESTISTVSKVF